MLTPNFWIKSRLRRSRGKFFFGSLNWKGFFDWCLFVCVTLRRAKASESVGFFTGNGVTVVLATIFFGGSSVHVHYLSFEKMLPLNNKKSCIWHFLRNTKDGENLNDIFISDSRCVFFFFSKGIFFPPKSKRYFKNDLFFSFCLKKWKTSPRNMTFLCKFSLGWIFF